MVDLKERAQLFEKLFDIQYRIILGRKGKTTEFRLEFKKEHFFHLLGLQYLKDIEYPTKSKAKRFDCIMNGDITYEMIEKSVFFKEKIEICKRIDAVAELEKILDSNYLSFKYNKNGIRWSNIKFKYIFESNDYEVPIYIFIDEICGKNMGCVSIFPKTYKDYTARQTKMTLIYKEKINLKTGEKIIQLNKLNVDANTKIDKDIDRDVASELSN